MNKMRKLVEARIRLLRESPDAGYVSEWVLVTALLASLALAVGAIIAALVIAKANGISL